MLGLGRGRRIALTAAVAAGLAIAGCGGGGGGKKSAASTTAPVSSTAIPSSGTTTIPITSATPTGPRVVSALWQDRDNDKKVSKGDAIVVTFSSEVAIGSGTLAPVASDFVLPVVGDSLGTTARITTGTKPTDVVILLGSAPAIIASGTFSSANISAGAPSGIDVASPSIPSITDLQGNAAVANGAVDIDDTQSTTPPQPAAPTLVSADYADVNSSGKLDAGDKITLRFSEDMVLGTGASAPAVADFYLPVASDSLGTGTTIKAGAKATDVEIVLGTGAVLTIPGTFDPTKKTAGSPSGLGLKHGTTGKFQGKTTGLDASTANTLDIGGTFATAQGPFLTLAEFVDVNGNGKIDAGDTITLTFSSSIQLGYPIGPAARDFLLPVMGDALGVPKIARHPVNPKQLVITIDQMNPAPAFNPNGAFDPVKTAPGSASGIGVAPTIPHGALVDFATKADVQTGLLVDIQGTIIPPTPPSVTSVFWVDRDVDGQASKGDKLVVEFNEPVRVAAAASAKDFQLPVAADSFGNGARVYAGAQPTEVVIELGQGPTLTIKGTFDKSKVSAGSASGLDVAATVTPGAITSAKSGLEPKASTLLWDIQEPLGALDQKMSDTSVKDAPATSADWNVANSGKVEASLTATDTGSGTDALVISNDVTIDTTLGTIDGVKSPAFKGAGVFEFDTIEIQKGFTVTVAGSSPLTLKAKKDATIDGTIVLDGGRGEDNTLVFAGPAGKGGDAGPGGFRGGKGADGDPMLAPGENGRGPGGGLGGGTNTKGGAGGGGGFVSDGANGEDGPNTATGPGGKGGKGGAKLDPTSLLLIPLQGGSGGGGGGGLYRATQGYKAGGAGGGGGGGAFRLAVGGSASIGGTISCKGGDGGDGGNVTGGSGAGGGAGGAILIQAVKDVVMKPSATLDCTGGSGGVDFIGGKGSDGLILVEANGQTQQLKAAVTGTVNPSASEGVVASSLDVGAGTTSLEVSADSTIDTDAGTLNGAAHPGFKGNGVFEVSAFLVSSGKTLKVTGKAPLVVKSAGKVQIDGTIDLNGEAGQKAMGLNGGAGGKGRAGGADGGVGGSMTLDANQNVASQIQPTIGGGKGGASPAKNTDEAGGGGGSFGTVGADGTTAGGGTPGTAGTTYGTADLATLEGGSGGSGGAACTFKGYYGAGGGGGASGGAIAIQAGADVTVSGTITSNGGDGGVSSKGGNGGAGSGGAIALRSKTFVKVSGALTALGGDGGFDGGAGGNGRIRLEDSVGSFAQGKISPAVTNGKFSTTEAVSTWIRLKNANGQPATKPRFMDLVVIGDNSAAGTAYSVQLEAAPDKNGQPDLANRTGFSSDVSAIQGKEFVRFRIVVKGDAASAKKASVERLFAPFK